MTPSPFHSLAQNLVAKGYRVFPIAPHEKFPAVYENGIWKPMNDWHNEYAHRKPTAIELDHWRLYYPENTGIGLLLGQGSGLVALDFDYDIQNLHKRIEEIAGESPVKKSGLKGYTAFYRWNGEKSRSYQMERQEVLGLLSDGRQTVLPPSFHPSGCRYEWWTEDTLETVPLHELPRLPHDFAEQMDDLFGITRNASPHHRSENAILADMEYGPTSIEKAREALKYVDPDLGYTEWVEIGMGLHDYFGDDGFQLWDEWSANGSKYRPNETARKWRSFKGHGRSIATLFFHAQQRGFVNIAELPKNNHPEIYYGHGGNLSFLAKAPPPQDQEPDTIPFESGTTIAPIANQPDPTPAPPPDIFRGKKYLYTEAPGTVGNIARWITNTALYPDPILALACAIAVMGAVKAHKVQTSTGLRTNVYTMGIALSGTGKDHPRKCTMRLLDAAGCANLLAGTPQSSSGLFNAVYRNHGRALMLIDEFGKVLGSMTSRKAAAHAASIPTLLMELFSSASVKFLGGEYSQRDPKAEARKDIDQPCLSVYATTTPKSFYEAISGVQVEDGLLSRFLIFENKEFPVEPKRAQPLSEPPEFIINAIKAWNELPNNSNPAGNIDGALNPKPKVVKFDPDAEKYMQDFQLRMRQIAKDHVERNTGMHAIYTRTAEHAAKLALIAQEGRSITMEVTEWACQVAEECTNWMVDALIANVANNEYEKSVKNMLRIITKAGDQGITLTELAKRTTTLRAKERTEILNHLFTTGEVESVMMEVGKRPSTLLRRVF